MTRYLGVASLALLMSGCAGDGCMNGLPTGFAAQERMPEAVQLRVTADGFRSLESAVKTLFPPRIAATVRSGCEEGEDADVEVCCDVPAGSCVVDIDMQQYPGDLPRLELHTAQAPGTTGTTFDAVMRMRIKTGAQPLRIHKDGPFGGDCEVRFDTGRSGEPSITAGVKLGLEQEALTGNTRIGIAGLIVDGLDAPDIDIRGDGFACEIADRFKNIAVNMIRDQLSSQAGTMIEERLCKPCATSAQCGPGGTCSAEGICMMQGAEGSRCMQELGMAGQLPAELLHPALGDNAALDMAIVAAGRATINGGEMSLGIAPGIRPGVAGLLTCGPSSPPPPMPEGGVPSMAPMQLGNGATDINLGLHKSFLDRIGWAVYESGLLCVTLDTKTLSVLNSNALSVLMPSIADLVPGGTSQVVVTMRPQLPPTIGLGRTAPLEIEMHDLIMDYHLLVDDRFIRLFTAESDLVVPLDLETDANGRMTPVIGDIGETFSNVRVQKTGMLEETEVMLASRLPAVGTLTTTFLTELLGAIQLPNIAGLALEIPPGGMRAADGFLAIAGRIRLPTAAAVRLSADTQARIAAVNVPPATAYAEPELPSELRPEIVLELAGTGPCTATDASGAAAGSEPVLEWQVRLDGGTWSRFGRERRLVLTREQLWLPGRHEVEVRARCAGVPASTDPTPVVLFADVVPEGVEMRAQHAAPDSRSIPAIADSDSRDAGPVARAAGCSASRGGAAWGLVLVMILVLLRRRRPSRRLRVIALAGLCAGTSACSLGAIGERERSQIEVYGRYSDVAAEGGRVLVSSYEEFYGDLVVGELSLSDSVAWRAVDGVPAGSPVTGMAAHRGGVTDPGEDVGAWTSIALAGGQGRVAYQDRGQNGLRFAFEQDGEWYAHEVDRVPGAEVGVYSSLAIGPDGIPAIAYMARNVPDGAGGLVSELRWAQASTPTPRAASEWTIETLARAAVSSEVSAVVDLPAGTGLFPCASWLPDGRAAVAFYNHDRGVLMLALRTSSWQLIELDAEPEADVGRFPSMVVGQDGTIHLAYHDATAGQLRYLSYRDGTVGAIEIADDGQRNDGNHSVGASAALVLDAQGNPVIAYQDQFDVVVALARRSAAGWSHSEIMRGTMGYGFSVAAAAGADSVWISSLAYDWRMYPPAVLVTTSIPNTGL